MNAVALSMLVHHYYIATDHPQMYTPAGQEALIFLKRNHLVKHCREGITTTPRGDAHVKALINAPLPTNEWKAFEVK